MELLIVRGSSQEICNISHIFCSSSGLNALANEAREEHMHYNQSKILLGHTVSEINTYAGNLPVIMNVYIEDEISEDPNTAVLNFWLIDMDKVEWNGVIPSGGDPNDFNPQIFDISHVSGLSAPMVQQRLGLIYGTLYLTNRGKGVYLLQVKVNRRLLLHKEQTYKVAA